MSAPSKNATQMIMCKLILAICACGLLIPARIPAAETNSIGLQAGSPSIEVAAYYFANYHTGDPRNEKNKGKGWSEWELVKDARPPHSPIPIPIPTPPEKANSYQKPVGRRYAIAENYSQISVITDRYKLGHWTEPPMAGRDFRSFGDLLFDRLSDPLELTNLQGKSELAEVERQLREDLAEWEQATPDAATRAAVEKGASARHRSQWKSQENGLKK